jgi:hypothetical protein
MFQLLFDLLIFGGIVDHHEYCFNFILGKNNRII